jgi:hypothetical protein
MPNSQEGEMRGSARLVVLLLNPVGLPILSRTEQTIADLRVGEGCDLRHEIQLVMRVPTLDADAISSHRNDMPVEVHVLLSALDSVEQDLHEFNPLLDLSRLRLPPEKRPDASIGGVLPGLVNLDSLSECECLAALAAGEQPAATAPRAVHLARRRDECIAPVAPAMAYEIVVRLSEVQVLCHDDPPLPSDQAQRTSPASIASDDTQNSWI